MSSKPNAEEPLHAGDSTLKPGQPLWHRDCKGLYWTGHHHHRTPQQLLDECLSTIRDICRNHPELEHGASSAKPPTDEADCAKYILRLPGRPTKEEVMFNLERMIHQWDDSSGSHHGYHEDALWLEEVRHIILSLEKDKERFDWLEQTQTGINYNVESSQWGVDYDAPTKPALRDAIDAAIGDSGSVTIRKEMQVARRIDVARTLLLLLWQQYDAQGHSLGRSAASGILEAVMHLLGPPRPGVRAGCENRLNELLAEASEFYREDLVEEDKVAWRNTELGMQDTEAFRERLRKEIESGFEHRMA